MSTDTPTAAAPAPAIPGWPATVDPEADYRIQLARPVSIGPLTMTPRHKVTVKGKVLSDIRDAVLRVEA